MHGGEYEFTAGPRVVESARQQPYREEQQFEEDGCVSTVAAAAAAVRPSPLDRTPGVVGGRLLCNRVALPPPLLPPPPRASPSVDARLTISRPHHLTPCTPSLPTLSLSSLSLSLSARRVIRGESKNIMFDKRVVRGSTYATHGRVADARSEGERIRSDQRRDQANQGSARRAQTDRKNRELMRRRDDPTAAVAGRSHMDTQTDVYIEELTDNVPQIDSVTQTEPHMQRPVSPLFIPSKIGVDVSTQIETDDLFDFAVEVEAILEVLVGTTLEKGMEEVMEEEELSAILTHKAKFERQRNIELAAVERLEEEAQRRLDEKSRRMVQEQKRVDAERQLEEKVAAQQVALDYLEQIKAGVFDALEEEGHFFDPLAKEVDEQFLPWLRSSATERVTTLEQAQRVTDEVIKVALQQGCDDYADAILARLQREAQPAPEPEPEPVDDDGE